MTIREGVGAKTKLIDYGGGGGDIKFYFYYRKVSNMGLKQLFLRLTMEGVNKKARLREEWGEASRVSNIKKCVYNVISYYIVTVLLCQKAFP